MLRYRTIEKVLRPVKSVPEPGWKFWYFPSLPVNRQGGRISAYRISFHTSTQAHKALQQLGKTTTVCLMQHGFTKAESAAGVLGEVYDQIGQQSLLLAFMDCFGS